MSEPITHMRDTDNYQEYKGSHEKFKFAILLRLQVMQIFGNNKPSDEYILRLVYSSLPAINFAIPLHQFKNIINLKLIIMHNVVLSWIIVIIMAILSVWHSV